MLIVYYTPASNSSNPSSNIYHKRISLLPHLFCSARTAVVN